MWPTGDEHSLQSLIHMETVFDILDLYLWLRYVRALWNALENCLIYFKGNVYRFSYRFPNVFVEPGKIKELQKELDLKIQETVLELLQKIKLTKSKLKKAVDLGNACISQRIEISSPLQVYSDCSFVLCCVIRDCWRNK